MARIELLHGSEKIITIPKYSLGRRNNDHGRGFYCTRDFDLAGEWACKKNTNGFINKYELDDAGLCVLNLSDGDHTVIEWISILLQNRSFRIHNPLAYQAKEYLVKNYAPKTKGIDIIIGYRADDSYFQYAEAFVENALPLRSLAKALKLGKLGLQTVLVSKKAFDQIEFKESVAVNAEDYYPKFSSRDMDARKEYQKIMSKEKRVANDIFVVDILREEMKADDPRIQRIICE